MFSSPLGSNMIERRRAWHAIIALGWQIRSNDVRRGMPSSPLGSTNGRTMSGVACHHSPWTANTVGRRRALHAITATGEHARSDVVGHGMPSWTAHTIGRRRAWYDITSLGLHAWSDDVRRGMTSPPLDCMHSWKNVERGMTSPPLGSKHGRTTSSVACHYRLWVAHMVKPLRAWPPIIAIGLRRVWHAIITLGQNTRLNYFRRGMP